MPRPHPAVRARRRWCVLACFPDGKQVVLRDFSSYAEAAAEASELRSRVLFVGRPYRLEVAERQLEEE